MSDQLIDERQAAAILGTSTQTLSNWRSTGRYHLPFVKVGRLVRYRQRDIEKFIADNTVGSGRE
uniref:Helix-turn-helix domain-containing protein n=1 Tax=Burkholderia cenocepacia TaxID=95486 RepID=A0A071MIW0_9BURK